MSFVRILLVSVYLLPTQWIQFQNPITKKYGSILCPSPPSFSLYSPGWPGIHCEDQGRLELMPPEWQSQVLPHLAQEIGILSNSFIYLFSLSLFLRWNLVVFPRLIVNSSAQVIFPFQLSYNYCDMQQCLTDCQFLAFSRIERQITLHM